MRMNGSDADDELVALDHCPQLESDQASRLDRALFTHLFASTTVAGVSFS
jgi:hypothetical protein